MGEKIVVTIDADLEEIIPTFLENRRNLGEIGAKMESACQTGNSDETKELFQDYCSYLENLEIKYED